VVLLGFEGLGHVYPSRRAETLGEESRNHTECAWAALGAFNTREGREEEGKSRRKPTDTTTL